MSHLDFANKLKAALESGAQTNQVVPADEAAIAATEDFKGRMGAFLGGVFWTAAQQNAIEKKGKELDELKQKIAELKKTVHSAESFLASIESLDPNETYSEEGYGKHFGAEWKKTAKDNFNNGFWNFLLGHKTIKNLLERGGTYGDIIKVLNGQIAEAKTEIARMEGRHSGTLEFLVEELSPETRATVESFFSLESDPAAPMASEDDAHSASLEGVLSNVASTAVGALAGTNVVTGTLHGAYRGHKIEAINKELRDVMEEIARTKKEISELTKAHAHHAATEGLAGAAGGAAAGGLSTLVPFAGMGVGAGVAAAQHATSDLLTKKKEELAKLKQRHIDLLRSAREALTEGSADLESLIASAESEAVIAAPAGGTETIVADEAPHRCEDHLIAADSCGDVMDSHLDEAGKLHRAVAQLESLMQVVHAEPNGLNQSDAKYVTLAVEHITADFAANVKLVPSIEAFGGPVSSQEATLTLEANVKEVAAQIWAYLKELWAKFMAALKNMWEHLFGAAQALGRSAKSLEERATAITGEPREKGIQLGPLARRVAVGGQLPSSLKGILTFMKLGELKTIAEKALDESEITAAVQKMSTGGNAADVATDASLREAFKTMPILNRELPGGITYVLSDTGEVRREVIDSDLHNATIPVMTRVELIHLGHEAGVLAAEAAAVLKDISAATAKDSGQFMNAITIEDEARAREVSHAVSVMVSERKRGLKLVADAIADYLKAAQALVAVGDKCVAMYGEAGHIAKAVDATKAAAGTAVDATKSAVAGAVDSAKAAGAAVAAKVGGGAAPAAEPAAAA